MTVSTTTAKVSYTGNGSTTGFAVPFVFFGSDELEVIERTIATGAEVVKALTTHYTVSGGNGATGTVTAVTAPASTVEWHIRRKTARTQLVDYQANDPFPADTHERALDRAAARDQEIEETVGRALAFPKTDSSALDPELPASVDRATKLLGFDSDGNPVVTTMTLDEIEEGATDAAASAVAAAASASAASGSASTASAAATAASGSAVAAAASAASIALPLPIGSGGTGQVTVDAALYALIAGATNDTAPNIANDKIGWSKASGTTGRSMSFQALWNLLNSLTAYTTLNGADEIALRDGSGGGNGVRKMTVANFLTGHGYQGRNIAGRNGGLEVWQRGAGGSASIAVAASTTAYTADGWSIATGANQASTISQQAGLTAGSRFCARVQRNNAQTGVTAIALEFPLDADEAAALSGNVVALSFTARSGANWSPSGGTLSVNLYDGTGSPAKRVSGAYTNDETKIASTAALTTTATRFTFVSSSALQASIRQASIYLQWTPTGTAGAADYFEIDDVQLEVSPVATAFERPPFDYELLRCQRHFWKSFAYGTAPAQNVGINTGEIFSIAGKAGAASERLWVRFPVLMRAVPTVVTFNPAAANAQARDEEAPGDCSSTAAGSGSTTGVQFGAVGNASTAVGNLLGVHATADAGI